MNNVWDFLRIKDGKVFWITQPFIQKTMMWLKTAKRIQKKNRREKIVKLKLSWPKS